MKSRILIIDDNVAMTTLLTKALDRIGYEPVVENNPLLAVNTVRHCMPDLIRLDVMMPELTGVQLLRMVRADALLQDTPVIFLTAKGETVDKVKGLESGADDYVTKPFDTRELMLRAQALLRRAKSAAAKPSTRLAAGALMLDIERHEVTASGKIVELTATEFKLLRLLLERKGRVQSREELLADVWNYSPDLETRTVDTHVRRLREKLGPSGDVIDTVRGVGYRVNG